MNIFILHRDPKENVKLYSDQHIRKMILETAQLLSFAHHKFPGRAKLDNLYKNSKSHANHPCALWVQESKANYKYLALLGSYLIAEYHFRFSKGHATSKVLKYLKRQTPKLPDLPMTTIPLVMPKEYHFISKIENKTVFKDAVKSYRRYYRMEKQTFKNGPATWTNRPKPEFLIPKT